MVSNYYFCIKENKLLKFYRYDVWIKNKALLDIKLSQLKKNTKIFTLIKDFAYYPLPTKMSRHFKMFRAFSPKIYPTRWSQYYLGSHFVKIKIKHIYNSDANQYL